MDNLLTLNVTKEEIVELMWKRFAFPDETGSENLIMCSEDFTAAADMLIRWLSAGSSTVPAESPEAVKLRDYDALEEAYEILVRELDMIVGGSEQAAARQASLCDLIGPVRKIQTALLDAEHRMNNVPEWIEVHSPDELGNYLLAGSDTVFIKQVRRKWPMPSALKFVKYMHTSVATGRPFIKKAIEEAENEDGVVQYYVLRDNLNNL